MYYIKKKMKYNNIIKISKYFINVKIKFITIKVINLKEIN